MLDFIFNRGEQLVVSDENRFSQTLRMRMKENGIKYSQILALDYKTNTVFSHGVNPVDIFEEALHLSLVCSGYQLGRVIRNIYDYDFHYKEILEINNHNNDVLSKEQATIFLRVFRALRTEMSYHFLNETRAETIRKATIERAGIGYKRRVYPDYSGCDELFAPIHEGPEDIVLYTAQKILEERYK